jgi:endonuclease/exonuclease/phosphatase family metal-dependent hydrolase
MRLVTYNIQYTKGRDGRLDLARIAETVRAADIIGMQEVDRYWQRTGSEDQAAALAERFPGYAWVYGAGYDAPVWPALAAHSSAEERGRRRQHGNMILSRWPILSSRVLHLPKAKPQEFCQLRVVLEAVIAAPGAPLRVYCTHLCHISAATRLPQVEQLLVYFGTLPQEGATWSGEHPADPSWADGDAPPPFPDEIVLMGDLNFTPASEEYAQLSNGGVGLEDSWRVLGRDPNAASEYSCKSMDDDETQRIDHIFVSPDLAHRVTNGWIDQEAPGSDHYPVWIELSSSNAGCQSA